MPRARVGVNALRNAFNSQERPNFDAAMAVQLASGTRPMGAKPKAQPKYNGTKSERAAYFAEYRQRAKGRVGHAIPYRVLAGTRVYIYAYVNGLGRIDHVPAALGHAVHLGYGLLPGQTASSDSV